jgi:hypothetical protein
LMIKIENRRGVAKRPSVPVSAMIVEPKRIGFAQTPVRKDQEACASVEVVGSAVVGSADWWPRIADWRTK